jgi:hypothetical protein
VFPSLCFHMQLAYRYIKAAAITFVVLNPLLAGLCYAKDGDRGVLLMPYAQLVTGGVALTPGRCQIGHMCDQNSTYGLHSLPGGVRLVTCATRT